MRAFVLHKPQHASIETIEEPTVPHGRVLLKVRTVGLCGSDLNSYRGLNPLVSYPRVPGHEVSATIVKAEGYDPGINAGMRCRALSLHKLWPMRLVSARPSERPPVQ